MMFNVSSDTNTIHVDNSTTSVSITSPVTKTYDDRRILLNISLDEEVEILEMSEDGDRFTRLCRNCDSYEKTRSFDEGFNNCRLLLLLDAGNEGYDFIEFTVDTREPKIRRTYPRDEDYSNGTFTIEYDEENLQNITLNYGNDETTTYDCPKGRREECSFDVNLEAYEGQEIEYSFTVCDSLVCVSSESIPVKVDTIPIPMTIFEPTEGEEYDRRVLINISLTEEARYLKYSDNDERFRSLCSRCDTYDRTKYFNKGFHNVTFMAVDKAGNENYQSVTFTVN